MGFIKFKALSDNTQDLFVGLDTGYFHGQTGMPPQAAAYHHAKAFLLWIQVAGGTVPDALGAHQAAVRVQNRPWRVIGQKNGLFPAGGHTGAALAAGGIRYSRQDSTDDSDIHNLGAGTGIGAASNCHFEAVVRP